MHFEKVSEQQFVIDSLKLGYTEQQAKEAYENIVLPTRSTKGSAGYDIRTPYAFSIERSNMVWTSLQKIGFLKSNIVTFPTGIRCKLDDDKFLMIVPRSGIGFKTGTRLSNSVGVIDSDYYYSNNEGHIMVKLEAGFDKLSVNAGERICQGIILPYFTVDDEDKEELGARDGGFGSTGK